MLGWALIFAATLGVVSNVFSYRDAQMDTDEAIHARDGQEYARAFRHLDLGELGALLSEPQWHPPAYGISLGIWFSAFGSSVLNARLYSVVFYGLLGFATWAAAYSLCSRHRGRLAFVATLIFALDANHAASGGMAMLEAPSGFFAMVALLLFTRAIAASGRVAYVLHTAASLIALLCFLTRYSQGIAVLGALAAAHVIVLAGDWRRLGARSLIPPAIFAFLVAVIAGGWLFGLGQLEWLLAYSGAQPRRVARWSVAGALFYPRFIFARTPFGPFVLLVFVAALAVAIWNRRLRREHAAYLCYLVVGFVLLFWVRQKAYRFGILLLAPFWVTTVALLDVWLRKPARAESWPAAFAFAGAVAVVGFLGFYRSPFPRVYENAGDGLARIYRTVGDAIEPWSRAKTSVLVLGRDDVRSGAALAFSLEAECERRGTPCAVDVFDELDIKLGWPRHTRARATYRSRLEAALREPVFVVEYGDTKRQVSGRPRLLERSFEYRRRLHAEPIALRVAVLGPPSEVARARRR